MTGMKGWSRAVKDRIIGILVPLVSFGGTFLGMWLAATGSIPDVGEFWYGCLVGACLLSYLAWRKPRRDIVSLCAPVYAFLIFVVPLENRPTLALELVFSASISLMVIRLEWKFSDGSVPVAISENTGTGEPMERYLDEYISRMKTVYGDIGAAPAHEIATTFLSFKFGLWETTIEAADHAIANLGNDEPHAVLKKALRIVRERADNLRNSDVTPVTVAAFDRSDAPYIAIVLPDELVEDPPTLTLHNALLLTYAVAYLRSSADEQALDEHRRFVIGIIGTYRRALDL
jgi:hypothetical protein